MRIEIQDKKQFIDMFNILYPNNKKYQILMEFQLIQEKLLKMIFSFQ